MSSVNLSKASTERNHRVLLELLKIPGNDVCADCRTRNPRWASWNIGIFICVKCAGIHRKMGTHISKVKSVTMDSWTREQVEQMKNNGNIKSNQLYSSNDTRYTYPTDLEESERDSELEKYIRQKYQNKRSATRDEGRGNINRPGSISSINSSFRISDSPSTLSPSSSFKGFSPSNSTSFPFRSPSASSQREQFMKLSSNQSMSATDHSSNRPTPAPSGRQTQSNRSSMAKSRQAPEPSSAAYTTNISSTYQSPGTAPPLRPSTAPIPSGGFASAPAVQPPPPPVPALPMHYSSLGPSPSIASNHPPFTDRQNFPFTASPQQSLEVKRPPQVASKSFDSTAVNKRDDVWADLMQLDNSSTVPDKLQGVNLHQPSGQAHSYPILPAHQYNLSNPEQNSRSLFMNPSPSLEISANQFISSASPSAFLAANTANTINLQGMANQINPGAFNSTSLPVNQNPASMSFSSGNPFGGRFLPQHSQPPNPHQSVTNNNPFLKLNNDPIQSNFNRPDQFKFNGLNHHHHQVNNPSSVVGNRNPFQQSSEIWSERNLY